MEFHNSMQQCAGSIAKNLTGKSAKQIHFLWDGYFRDIISKRGPTYMKSSWTSPICIAVTLCIIISNELSQLTVKIHFELFQLV